MTRTKMRELTKTEAEKQREQIRKQNTSAHVVNSRGKTKTTTTMVIFLLFVTDSAIDLPKPAARDEEGCAEKYISPCILLSAKDYRPMASGWQGAPYFRRHGYELVSKPAISSKKSWGKATAIIIERLFRCYQVQVETYRSGLPT